MPQPLKVALIASSLVDLILEEANRQFPRETGGILAGYSGPSGECCITEIIGPGPRARHTRTNYDPVYEYHVEQVASIYQASQQKHTYLGDWHTHPRGPDQLSGMDRAALKHISSYTKARCTFPLMLLVVGGPIWELRLWQWSPNMRSSTRSVNLSLM